MFYKLLFSIPFIWRLILFIGYLSAIVFASLARPKRIPKIMVIPHIDKIVHFIMYFGFCLLAAWVFDRSVYADRKNTLSVNNPNKLYAGVLLLAITWGAIMEIFQHYMTLGRHFSVNDMLANAIGALAGILLYKLSIGNAANRA